MISLGVCRLSLFSWIVCVVYGGHNWAYEGEYGPHHWCHAIKSCCGKRQSPINLSKTTAKEESIPPIKFHHYENALETVTIKNNGHSVYVETTEGGLKPVITDGGLGGTYTFGSFHFHWGDESDKGSEHSIGNTFFPVEMHLVHHNSRYGNIATAVSNSDGLAVLGVLFELREEDNPNFNEIFEALEGITYSNQSVILENADFTLDSLLPPTDGFFRYLGSLTTPNCNEIVTWTVFEARNYLSLKQVKKLRSLKANMKSEEHERSLNNNFRPPQKLYNRQVFRRVAQSSSSSAVCSSLTFTIASLLASLKLSSLFNSAPY